MQKQIQYQQIEGAKQAFVQFELDTYATKEEIARYRCSDKKTPVSDARFPHESLLFALMLDNFQQGMLVLKQKKDTPYDINYNVLDGKFILSVSFVQDTWSIKEVSSLILKKMIVENYELIYKTLKHTNNDFYQKHDKEEIFTSLRHIYEFPRFLIMGKGTQQSLKAFLQKLQAKLESKQIKENQPNKINKEFTTDYISQQYVQMFKIENFGEFLSYMFIASMNLQQIQLILNKTIIYVKKGSIIKSVRDNQYKFMKDRIKIFDFSKYKPYKNLTQAQKEKYKTQKQYEDKLQQQIQKKLGLLLQMIYASGSVQISALNKLQNDMNSLKIETLRNDIISIQEYIEQFMKSK